MERPARGGCWPTAEQTLLLRAALLTGAPAVEAYRTWRERVTLDGLDRGSLRLLPLLAQNLRRHDVRDPIMTRLDEVCRDTRARNAVLMTRLATLLGIFAGARLDTMLLKGSALLVLYYPDPGVRPMSDLDLLVRTSQAPAAMTLLRRSGWQPTQPSPERVVPVTHSLLFLGAEDAQLDLHWHVLWECGGPEADEDFWAAADSVTVGGVPTAVLGPADQLFHACVHGAAWNPVPPLRWAADALVILQARGPGLAWDRLLVQAGHLRLVRPLLKALTFLRSALDAPVPTEVLAALRAAPLSMLERFEYRARIRPWGRTGALPRLVGHYLRLGHTTGLPRGPLGFPRYLQRVYGVARLRDLPTEVWRRLRQPPGRRHGGPAS